MPIGDVAETAESRIGLERRQRDQPDARLRDVDRLIADALEIGVDLDDRPDVPEVRGDRMLEREQLEAQVVDLELELVDRRVARRAPDGQLGPALLEQRRRRRRATRDSTSAPIAVEPLG